MKTKRILSILLCIVMLISAVSLSAFANQEEPYAEIRFRNPEKYNVAFGETEEVYLEYGTGGIENYKIEWDVSEKLLCKIEYIMDEETGHITGAKLTGKNFGGLTLTSTILDENGNEIVSANKTIRVVESGTENKTFEERVKIFFRDSYIAAFMASVYVIIPIVVGPFLTPYYAYLTVKQIVIEFF